MPDPVGQFQRRYPGTNLELRISSRFVDLTAVRFDAAVRISAPEDATLVMRKLVDIPMVFCVSEYVNCVINWSASTSPQERAMASQNSKAAKTRTPLKPVSELESVPVSRLARRGTELLSRLTASSQGVAVRVQGVGSMVALSSQQYDEMVAMINELNEAQSDGFAQALSQQFDVLVERMNQADAETAIDEALFSGSDVLNASYQPGDTESKGSRVAESAD
jgi:hypothetical protein